MTDADGRGLSGGWPPEEVDTVLRGVPRHLGLFLGQLADLTTEGRRYALGALGPGSRLVLEALRLVEVGSDTFTSHGEEAIHTFADQEDDARFPGLAPVRSITPIAHVSPQSTFVAADQGTVAPATRETYNLYEDRPGEASTGSPVASVLVVLRGTDLMAWQASGRRAVVLRETDEDLPRVDMGGPAVLPNAEDEAPVTVLRRRLGVAVDE